MAPAVLLLALCLLSVSAWGLWQLAREERPQRLRRPPSHDITPLLSQSRLHRHDREKN